MTQKRSTKRAFWMSALSLLLCVSMLVGTTYAWFTDSVASGMNTIMAGNLDVALLADGKEVDAETKLFDDVTLWEPGAVVYENLQVVNKGSLALQYQMALNFEDENELEGHKLSEVLKVAIIDKIENADRATVLAAAKAAKAVSLYDFFVAGSLEANAEAKEQGVVIFWEPGENDNLYNANNGKTTSNGNPLGITFGIKLVATQVVSEKDSFGNEYDKNAGAEFFDGFQGGTVGVAVKTDDQGLTTAEVAQAGGDVAVRIPAGVKVKDGVSTLKLSVTKKDHADANVQLNENEEMRPLDVHIEGVAEGNTVPMLITLKHYLSTGINTGALRLYHVENGTPVAMTQVATPTAHNEFSYDPATGDLVLAMASFSEVAVGVNSTNPWNGTAATAFGGGTGTEADPYLIANADQLAYFRNEVDGGNDFEGKFVKLNNNIYLDKFNFDPIGWGYVNTDWNRKDAKGNPLPGKPFKGTFDGNGKIIFDLYQQGWELEEASASTQYPMDYTYTNCGFGLFASASGATFQNLTIYGADIKTECVEMGVLVGLSQGDCTYKDINIENSKIANYQRPAGGLIGEVSGDGTTTITNVVIGADVVVGSLWGDFDAPCGGVIGARWDDAGENPQIKMENVKVHCRMDVYSDVTSAYQWYAYRRAGMLIGNTELTDPQNQHLAYAKSFLTCNNVEVCYGDWADYHYCQFTNQDNDWCNNYPWVRVEAGENCSAYSNPRYGQPVIDGVTVTTHSAGTCTGEHEMELRFNQLYGGGQGVYGQPLHENVTADGYKYSITYMNNGEVLSVKYVSAEEAANPVSTKNPAAQDLVERWAADQTELDGWDFVGWMNAGSSKLDNIHAGNDKNIVLYPSFLTPFTASFVDTQGNVLASARFNAEAQEEVELARIAAEEALPAPGEGFEFDYWMVGIGEGVKYDEVDFSTTKQDVTIYPVYRYVGSAEDKYEGDVSLIPVDSDDPKDGVINYYQVEGYGAKGEKTVIKIPDYVNGVPVTEINAESFGSYKDLHSIVIPETVVLIQDNAFTTGESFGSGEEITIYYEGTRDDWEKVQKADGWSKGIGTGTRIFFLKDDKVDTTQGYLEVTSSGILWWKEYEWSEKSDFSSVKKTYQGNCTCSVSGCKGNLRPDAQYWEGV